MNAQSRGNWIGRLWSAGFNLGLVLCGLFLVGVGIHLVVRGFRTKLEPVAYSAAEFQRLARQDGLGGNEYVMVKEATAAWPDLWTYVRKTRSRRLEIHYLPLVPVPEPPGQETAAPPSPAMVLRLTPAQLAGLRTQAPPAYRGMRMQEIDVAAPERKAVQTRFGPTSFTSLPFVVYEEKPNLAANLAGGLMNGLFGCAMLGWAAWRRRGTA